MRNLILALITYLICVYSFCHAELRASEPSRPIQQCAQEYGAREQALRANGVSAASFFHECWWHTMAGHQTDTTAMGRPPTLAVTASENQRAAAAPRGADRPAMRPAYHVVGFRRNAIAQGSTHREARTRVAHLSRHAGQLVATRHSGREQARMRVARARTTPQPSRTAAATRSRFALRSRAQPRLLYAIRRDGSGSGNKRVTLASAVGINIPIPPNALEGQRAWVRMRTPDSAATPAVLIGSSAIGTQHSAHLHCWNQDVLFVHGQAQWAASLVCDDKTAPGATPVWFDSYR